MGSSSSEDESDRTVNSITPYQKKQPAVRISAYQRYGPVTREKPGREKRISYRQRGNVRFPKYRKQATTFRYETSLKNGSSTCSTLQQGTRFCVRVLQDGTSHVLIALDEARQKIIQAQVDRRRRQLKSKIRLIGPVNPYTTYGRVDPWIWLCITSGISRSVVLLHLDSSRSSIRFTARLTFWFFYLLTHSFFLSSFPSPHLFSFYLYTFDFLLDILELVTVGVVVKSLGGGE